MLKLRRPGLIVPNSIWDDYQDFNNGEIQGFQFIQSNIPYGTNLYTDNNVERLYEINDFAGIKDTQIPYYIGYNFYPGLYPNNGYYVLRYNYYLKYGLFFPGQYKRVNIIHFLNQQKMTIIFKKLQTIMQRYMTVILL